MKIGIEVQRLFRKKKFGIESSSLELIRTLKELEPRHDFVVFAKDDEDRNCLNHSDRLKIRNVDGIFFADFEQFFLPIAARREHVDILHCTGNTAPYFAPAPVVQTLHDVIFMDSIPEDDSFYQQFGNHYRRKVVPLITPRSRAVITVSHHEKERILTRLNIDEKKVHVVYNGINEKRFYPHRDAAERQVVQAKYHLPDDFMLFLGNPTYRKNPSRVIESYVRYAARSPKPMALVTPGLPEKFVTDKLRELNYPYSKNQFITTGYIDEPDLPVLYGLSKIFLFPSLSEGFGMPLVEAMACGAPVITSRISSMPEIAADAAMLINPLNTDEIAEAMLALSSNERMRNTKIDAGLSNAKRFNWKKSAEQVLRLYETVLQEVRPARKARSFFFMNMHLDVASDK
ncbi:MAG: glycosyltransferase family 1 protein [Cyclobacteriaceae bacterium]